ncbi:phosphopentomutase [Anaeromyxobacter sp. Fw109-5]|uniref:Phosphopentomutase n=1 Tax=Anaeromyxobacter sp. (strain Fw109-5) TaxID=404589 RepID=DEOB_ANADF|nr:phosphopentomutase [Anaeromyxobacter sp. Fw109-5]A7H8W4.1 RecName: Full=Phosphopentomutase; AltName: Full=Phosphodeoxyribomutase [Anaeromyxobacter sp. Fw109-5]ABS25160.1 phosphopentomutase [Anaeromyxobacter sp. Fw109-5]
MDRRRFVILVADSVGCGALPDARAYGDEGSDTLGNTSRAVGGLSLPVLGRMGIGHLTPILGVPPEPSPLAFHGRMAERSQGKDTITGHWEMMGIVLSEPLALFPRGFPPEILDPFLRETGLPGVLGNVAASGTEIIRELGEEHQRTGMPIVYTSADSVFQIAAHEETVPLETLYAWCRVARRILDPYRVARVIARPFVGKPGEYVRTYHRKDFSIATPGRTVLEKLVDARVPVVGVGKIPDIFDRKGITDELHTAGNADGLAKTEALLDRVDHGLVFVNLVDFDMLYGHRNDPQGYARALEEMDRALPRILGKLRPGEVAALTADHGCDPTTPSTDHSREYVPLVVHAPGRGGGALGTRGSFADLGATVADFFGVRHETGRSFLGDLGP